MTEDIIINKSKQINPNKIAIYVRWSTDDQALGTSLDVQLEGCKHYILSQGWKVSESLIFIDDGYSGGNLERPAITELRKKIKNKEIDCVVVFKLDRLSRSVLDTVSLVLDEWDNKTYLKSAREPLDTSTPFGKQMFYILSSFAEFERSLIYERTFSGKIKRASEGKNPGVLYPYGYKKSSQPSMYEIIPEEAEIVKRMFNDYLKGKGVLKIAADLSEDRIYNRKNHPWSNNTIAQILKNKTYIGIFEYGRTTRNKSKNYKENGETVRIRNEQYSSVESQYIPPIIDEEIFYAVQKQMKNRSVNVSGISGRSYTSNHLLSGILKCKCGFSRSGVNAKKNEKFSYYECIGKKTRGKTFCDSGNIREDLLDAAIIQELKNRFLNKEEFNKVLLESKKNDMSQAKFLESNIKKIESEILSFNNQFKRVDSDYLSGRMDIETHGRFYTQIKEEEKEAKNKLEELKQQYEEIKNNESNLESLKQIPPLLEQWDNLTIYERKNVIRNAINSIVAYKIPYFRTAAPDVVIDWTK